MTTTSSPAGLDAPIRDEPGSTERLALEVDHVTKLYGDHTVVDDLSSLFSQVA